MHNERNIEKFATVYRSAFSKRDIFSFYEKDIAINKKKV